MKDRTMASSPGRLDVMGGIADYSGSLVLQMPIKEQTTVTITLRTDYQCNVHSTAAEGVLEAKLDYREIFLAGEASYDRVNAFFKKEPSVLWTAYVIGCAVVLQKEKAIDFRGADFEIRSDVPLGKGVSSSAALEVATMKALGDIFNVAFNGTELPRLAQRVENLIVGAPCGLMDQLASYFGRSHALLPILCQPDVVYDPLTTPDGVAFVGIDSGVRHAVSGASYGDVRCAAFMGYSIAARHAGATPDDLQRYRPGDQRLPWRGYLANLSAEQFEREFFKILPERMTGQNFIDQYKYTIDTVTSVEVNKTYCIRDCASHPVYENERVVRFRELLRTGASAARELGALMYASHESYSLCGLGSQRTDEIVNRAREYSNIAGAKITGGGSGGTVCLLTVGDKGRDQAKELHGLLEKDYRMRLKFFEGD